ncbi:cytochrome P450 71A9-like [Lolium rigidum]|uniref:cytochrome P450 71A9-like n=1 Tax=Lolium rigidum TaxID=89674 RepID=UPI001F5C863B|nr:cytochrome P450 71A9-like [Lolium rigidum]
MAWFQAHELFAWLLVVVATLLVLKQLLAPAKKRAASPSLPRPRGLPLIGNLHQLGALPQDSLAVLATRHAAPLMLLRLGSVPTLVVSSPDAARALFQHNDRALSGRPALYAASRFSYGLQNISFAPTEGTFWRAARRACLSELLGAPRVRGFRNAREGAAAALVAAVEDASGAGAPVDLSGLLIATSNRIVTRVAFGDRDDGGLETSAVLKETQSLLGAFWVADYVPWLGWLDALRGLRGRLERNFHQLDAFYERVIDSHLNKRTDEEDEEEDLVDVLLRLHADPAQGGTFGSRDRIKGILTDMFIAGTDTSAATVEWTMTELVNHPDVLAKAQHEVRSVVGDGSDMVREPDLRGLEYLKLVIKESMRLHPPVPLLVPRETIEPCTVQGCEVPAGTRVLVNAKAIGTHPGTWGPDAALFVPERHSEVDAGKDFRPWVDDSFALVPFGIGRRSCPGVHFATAVVELVLANLLFSFDWSAPLGEAVDTEEVNGLTVYRKNPLVLLAKRTSQ